MYESGNLRKGLKLEINGDPHIVINFEFMKPGKGRSLYKCKLKNMLTGTQFEKTFRSGEKFKKANIEKIEMEYLYTDGNGFCFMNLETYEQALIGIDIIGEAKSFLKENIICEIIIFKGNPVGISFPNFVELKVVESEPWIKGNTALGFTKPVKLETGYIVQVPPFINVNATIKLDTRTGEYVERVK